MISWSFLRDFKKLHNIIFLFLIIILPLSSLKSYYVAFLSTLMFTISVTPTAIRLISSKQKYGQPIRDDGPKGHLITKRNTPTMGGLIIIGCGLIGGILATRSLAVLPLIYGAVFFGALGFADDFVKIKLNNSKGLRAKAKFAVEIIIAVFISMAIYSKNPAASRIFVPFLGLYNIDIFFIPLSALTIVGTANAFNLTDGLDGLAIGQFLIISLIFILGLLGLGTFGWLMGLTFSLEIVLFLAAFLGSSVCFWFYNTFPARIFMGDVGSLGLGALVGVMFVMTGLEIVLIGLAIIPVIETLSVILQVAYFRKTRGKRLFLMTPIHHHFEKLNIHENRITLAAHLIAITIGVLIMF